MNRPRLGLLTIAIVAIAAHPRFIARSNAQDMFNVQGSDYILYDALRWRMIGPFRGGRTVGATGVPGQPNLFYTGVNNGGVWRTNDSGRTWKPIFDDQPTGSIGALAVAPSDPNVIYVGSGEGLQRPDLSVGDGIYKSVDGGKTWEHLGLRDGLQIGAILIDPHDPNRVFVAVLGHPYGANEERGVFRSTDGGKTWAKVLYKDENTGAIALAADPKDRQTLYADLWAGRQAPWENGHWQGPNSGLYKSTDGGDTWRQLTKGLPTIAQGLGRIGIGVAPSNGNRMYALVDANEALGGVYRSEDAGESWTKVNGQMRLWERGDDFAEIKVDPKDPDRLYVANTSTYRSTDGGKTFTAWKGAPGGDDYHTIWISPDNPDIILLASDQGAVVTVNGGETWSSWYNQPTAQFYHVSTDNQFPYWVYGGQQESGSAAVMSRGPDGQITFREWHPVAAEEYGYVAPDPLHPNLVYGGKLSRYDRLTGQAQSVGPQALRRGEVRFLRTAPVMFSPADPTMLLYAGNVIFKTNDGAQHWDVISPDLSREQTDVPASIGVYRTPELAKMRRRGVVYSLGPSPLDRNLLWAGTDDGLVHVTRDLGKTWANVTPPDLTAWSKVSQIDAGHFDKAAAYLAINRIRLDDLHPYLYRTHDGGKTWTRIVRGLPDDSPTNTIREDPVRAGLLYCGTERAVYFSIDDGENWLPLRLNMPATSIRDLVVHEDDLVVGTHGRSFWILDDVTPLRQIDGKAATRLFKPQTAIRVRWNTNPDTPLPPDEPGGKNPPEGAILNYVLAADAKEVSLEIVGEQGEVLRRFSSSDKPFDFPETDLQVPQYWIRPFQPLARSAGSHRFIWDLRLFQLPPTGWVPMQAIVHDTTYPTTALWALPGQYKVRLTVDRMAYEQPLALKMDPRVTTSLADLRRQFQLSKSCLDLLAKLEAARGRLRADEVDGVMGGLGWLLSEVEGADLAPTAAMDEAFKGLQDRANALLSAKPPAKP